MNRNEMIEQYCIDDVNLVFLEPGSFFDRHIIGVWSGQWNSDLPTIAYDEEGIMESFIDEGEGMTYEEAREHMDYNVMGAFVGKQTPIFIQRFDVKTDI
jgi:hypothetical protein